MHRYLILGTDTGVGKTYVAGALCAALLRAGLRVTALKPVETGYPNESDLERIAQSCGFNDRLRVATGIQFSLPASPSAAARAENRPAPTIAECAAAARAAVDVSDAVVVETCGGAFTPLSDREYVADFVAALPEFRTFLVAGLRLGVLSHAFGAAEYFIARGLAAPRVVLNDCYSESPAWYIESTRADLASRRLAAAAYVAHGAPVDDPVFMELIDG
jgi:dethiobiotin synthase